MNTSFLRATASMTLLMAANLAFADHLIHRDLEDKAYSAIVQAREIRTEIRDHFDGSSSYGVLMDEATKLYRSAIELEDALLCGKPSHVVCREVDQTLAALKCFRDKLDDSDFACAHPGHFRTTSRGNGYSFRPATRHAGYAHVIEVRKMLDGFDATVECLHDDVEALAAVRPVPVRPAPVIPYHGSTGGFRDRPIGPTLPPPSAGRPRGTIDVPVNFGSRGGIVLQIPMKSH